MQNNTKDTSKLDKTQYKRDPSRQDTRNAEQYKKDPCQVYKTYKE